MLLSRGLNDKSKAVANSISALAWKERIMTAFTSKKQADKLRNDLINHEKQQEAAEQERERKAREDAARRENEDAAKAYALSQNLSSPTFMEDMHDVVRRSPYLSGNRKNALDAEDAGSHDGAVVVKSTSEADKEGYGGATFHMAMQFSSSALPSWLRRQPRARRRRKRRRRRPCSGPPTYSACAWMTRQR